MDLFNRWSEASEHVDLLGEDAYREQLVQVLSRVVPRDCAAARFGCTRRMDRSCQEPEVCAQDPPPGAGEAVHREGPRPGGCDHYVGWWGDSFALRISFGAGDRHRAVQWDRRLWIDGLPIADDQTLDECGHWLDDRFFVILAEGPDDHPAQSFGWDSLASTIRSVVVHDADRGSTVVLVPAAEERWTNPAVVRNGDVLLIYPDRVGGAPDRTLRVF
ncbi:hypothetical protein J2S43_001595 [Catenuloplanes nepalensis]|uniref:Uncharacterized protein n=1 Tax=Catenuloplanes nepalensis TaxID=587533 RepID=A0ABT9MP71_9ACTN|nr:hypothetical protein [Catenuloplanes nepalensis]MDP9793083.1 hypothetical protein [Catenuloplanes nepalensis]